MLSECPSAEALAALLDTDHGDAAETAAETHIRGCMRCQQRLDLITGNPRLVHATARRDDAWVNSHSAHILENVASALSHDAGAAEDSPTSESGMPAVPGYEVIDRIGSGGTADVYRAFHKLLRRVVALKISRERAKPAQRDRFRREAEALARLQHPGVVQIYETGHVNGSPYISLEYVPRGSLAQFLNGTPQPALDAARFMIHAARAVHAAHDVKLVHRDLKPGNILLHEATPDPKGLGDYLPKVTDFGLVKLETEASLTASRDVLGTPSYMAPEQVAGSGAPPGPATDVYALGAVLYELLTGRPPFRAASPIDTVVQVRFDEPVPPSRLTPSVPRDLETICLKCLEKEPPRRYATAAALANDLTRFAEGRPVAARPVRWPTRFARWTRRNPRVAVLSALVLGLLTVLAFAGPIVAIRQAKLRHTAELAEAKALAQWDRADQNLLAANNALWQTMMVKVVELDRSEQPGAMETQLGIIESVMPYLDRARARDPDLPLNRQRGGIALYLHGRAALRTGRLDRAAEDFANAAIILDRLAEDRPDLIEAAVSADLTRLEQARLATLRKSKDAEARIRDAAGRFEKLDEKHPFLIDVLLGHTEALRLLIGHLETDPARLAEITAPAEQQVRLYGRIAGLPSLNLNARDAEIAARLRLAKQYDSLLRPADAEREFRTAADAAGKSEAGTPASPNRSLLQSQALERLAELQLRIGQAQEADRSAAAAAKLSRGLAELFPDVPSYSTHHAHCLLGLANARFAAGHAAEAIAVLDDAVEWARGAALPADLMTNLQQARTRMRAAPAKPGP